MPPLDRLLARLGLDSAAEPLLLGALTHSSYRNEHPDLVHELASADRLEFLGDALVNQLAAEAVYQALPQANEGELSERRMALVRTSALASFGRELGLGAYVRISKGEERNGARQRETLLADTFEAVVAVVQLSGGPAVTQQLLGPLFAHQLAQPAEHTILDYKTTLIRRIQAERGVSPRYRTLSETGPDHQRTYTVEVYAGETTLAAGVGHSKQQAQQAAAQAALAQLDAPTEAEL